MRCHRTLRSAAFAALLVGGATALPLLTVDNADAGPSRARFARDSDNDRTLDVRRGPFFGLRVNSMDVASDALVFACFRYRCPSLAPDGAPDRYHVVRSAQVDLDVDVGECDELLGRALGDRVVSYRAITITTRWIRDVGPNGRTPVGGFIGRMDIDALVRIGDSQGYLPYLDFGLIGTQGLRPHRGDPDAEADANETTRCDAVFHDEGYYDGHFDRRGLRRLLGVVGDDPIAIARLRRLASTRIVGTFEGKTRLDEDRASPYDFCELDEVVWWMDGIAGYRCKKPPEVDDSTPADVALETPRAAR
jgi:hypothetical protein